VKKMTFLKGYLNIYIYTKPDVNALKREKKEILDFFL
jgi:hypothetical protein